jgi:hypothetical protein
MTHRTTGDGKGTIMSPTVFIVMLSDECDSYDILGVFDTKEKAQNFESTLTPFQQSLAWIDEMPVK